MTESVFLGIGSNLGDRMKYLREAVRLIGELPRTSVAAVSRVYETEPYGLKDQPMYLNAVLEARTELSPEIVHEEVKRIERNMGRRETKRWGPREIDIDILYFGPRKINTDALHIPHPGVRQRRFVLCPLAELAGDFRDPESGLTVEIMLKQCDDESSVREFTQTLTISSP